LRAQLAEADRALEMFVRNDLGNCLPVHQDGAGRPARKFHLLRLSTATQFGISRGKTENSVDADTYKGEKITPVGGPKIEPVSAKKSASEPANIVIGKDPEGETIL